MILDKRIVNLKEEIQSIINDGVTNNRFTAFEFDKAKEALAKCEALNDYDKYSYCYEIVSNLDSNCNLSTDTGIMINNLMNNPNNVLAIHRTNLGEMNNTTETPTNINLENIMENGLINNGHSMQGAVTNTPSLALTTTPLISLGDLFNLLKSYKDNNATILLQFPKDMIDKELELKDKKYGKELYNEEDGISYIKPEYILGAILKKDNKKDFYTKEEILKNKQNIDSQSL